jgi:hypothetical protein
MPFQTGIFPPYNLREGLLAEQVSTGQLHELGLSLAARMILRNRSTYKRVLGQVMSSRLSKKVEGAVFPFQVESLEDGVEDAVHAFYVDEADHGRVPRRLKNDSSSGRSCSSRRTLAP